MQNTEEDEDSPDCHHDYYTIPEGQWLPLFRLSSSVSNPYRYMLHVEIIFCSFVLILTKHQFLVDGYWAANNKQGSLFEKCSLKFEMAYIVWKYIVWYEKNGYIINNLER